MNFDLALGFIQLVVVATIMLTAAAGALLFKLAFYNKEEI